MKYIRYFCLVVLLFTAIPSDAITPQGCQNGAPQGCVVLDTFDPLTDSRLRQWYDFQDTGTVAVTGAGISTLEDKSAEGNDLTQTSDTERPNYVSGSHAEFDGTEFLSRTTFTGGNQTQPTVDFMVLDAGTQDSNRAYGAWDAGNRSFYNIDDGIGQLQQIFAGSFVNEATLPSSKWMSIVVFDGASSALYNNCGAAVQTGNAGANAREGFVLGGGFGGSNPIIGDIYEFLSFEGTLTTAELQERGGWLAAKHGLTCDTIP